MATLYCPQLTATLNPQSHHPKAPSLLPSSWNPLASASPSFLPCTLPHQRPAHSSRIPVVRAAGESEFSSRRSSGNDSRETIMLPGCDYNHWLIVMEFPKDPAPTREQMIDTYLQTLATVLGSMEEAKKNMYAFSTTTYTGFQCTVDEETSEKFKGLPGVLWVLPDSYLDVKNKDYGGDKYVNGEIIPGKYPTYQPRQNTRSKYKSKAYVRQRDGPPADKRKPKEGATPETAAS